MDAKKVKETEERKELDKEKTEGETPEVDGCNKAFTAEDYRLDEDDDACFDGVR